MAHMNVSMANVNSLYAAIHVSMAHVNELCADENLSLAAMNPFTGHTNEPGSLIHMSAGSGDAGQLQDDEAG
jgi:hypothetical protein